MVTVTTDARSFVCAGRNEVIFPCLFLRTSRRLSLRRDSMPLKIHAETRTLLNQAVMLSESAGKNGSKHGGVDGHIAPKHQSKLKV